jgi:hypothetical protein
MIIVLILGSIEACTMVFVKQSLHIAAYEGSRRAIRYDGTDALVTARCEEILDERDIEGATIELTPTNVEDLARGQDLTLRITAPVRENSVMQFRFFRGNLQAETTMVKE